MRRLLATPARARQPQCARHMRRSIILFRYTSMMSALRWKVQAEAVTVIHRVQLQVWHRGWVKPKEG